MQDLLFVQMAKTDICDIKKTSRTGSGDKEGFVQLNEWVTSIKEILSHKVLLVVRNGQS